ncbi:MarR family winged helix-turn-helix transcriptional regulator [Kineosporia succinea]|uniref:DNA-binding MarR family transcriptional regulator n=1 Tax=Kineosporia succinea TaxID=84632 RepID=A0ABT9NZK6_9ACTN|nr:MarR family transcriptional regulator [Kineosporia succinea]MDP9825876.1 DNA-binding MarR family transcriptional regulator [Kineosporia succinea]
MHENDAPAADDTWLSEAEQGAWRAYLDSTRMLFAALDRQLAADSDLTLTDYDLLVRLSEAPDGKLRMRELADLTLSTRSGVTRAVTRAEQAGWVRRVECEEDRRGMNAELTDAGRAKLAASAPGHVRAVREMLINQLTPEQLGQLTEIGLRVQGKLHANES